MKEVCGPARAGLQESMNERSLNHDELETLFQVYRDVPTLNEVELLAPPSVHIPEKACLSVRMYGKERTSERTIPIGKALVDLYSEKRCNSEGNHAYTTTVTFPAPVLPEAQVLYDGVDGAPHCRYVHMRGRIQGMRPHLHHPRLHDYMELLYGIARECCCTPRDARYIAKLTGFSGGTRLERSMVWLTDVEDGDEFADARTAAGKAPTLSRARIAGLIYMPPCLSDLGLQFRVRVPRGGENEELPKDYRSKDGYDYVNVRVKDMKEAERLFGIVRQGHPVYVEGSVESMKFWSCVKPKNMYDVANVLGVSMDSPSILQIYNFFDGSRSEKPMLITPTLDVWADRVVAGVGAVNEALAV